MRWDIIGVIVVVCVVASLTYLAVAAPEHQGALVAALIGIAGTLVAAFRGKVVESKGDQ